MFSLPLIFLNSSHIPRDILFYYIPSLNLLLFFSEIVLISSRVKYFISDDITFSYFTSDDMTFAVISL